MPPLHCKYQNMFWSGHTGHKWSLSPLSVPTKMWVSCKVSISAQWYTRWTLIDLELLLLLIGKMTQLSLLGLIRGSEKSWVNILRTFQPPERKEVSVLSLLCRAELMYIWTPVVSHCALEAGLCLRQAHDPRPDWCKRTGPVTSHKELNKWLSGVQQSLLIPF